MKDGCESGGLEALRKIVNFLNLGGGGELVVRWREKAGGKTPPFYPQSPARSPHTIYAWGWAFCSLA